MHAVIIDARGVTNAGVIGGILATRLRLRGCAAIVTDGAVRDSSELAGCGMPVFCGAAASPASLTSHFGADYQVPIGCGGVAVFPDDVVVVDEDGAVLIPQALVAEIVAAAPEQERLEGWIMSEVEKGASLPGLYPPNAENKARFEASKKG